MKENKIKPNLVDLIVYAISLVDRPANGRVFFLRKGVSMELNELVKQGLISEEDAKILEQNEGKIINEETADKIKKIISALASLLAKKDETYYGVYGLPKKVVDDIKDAIKVLNDLIAEISDEKISAKIKDVVETLSALIGYYGYGKKEEKSEQNEKEEDAETAEDKVEKKEDKSDEKKDEVKKEEDKKEEKSEDASEEKVEKSEKEDGKKEDSKEEDNKEEDSKEEDNKEEGKDEKVEKKADNSEFTEVIKKFNDEIQTLQKAIKEVRNEVLESKQLIEKRDSENSDSESKIGEYLRAIHKL